MSVNQRDTTTGELVTLASGTRMWVGTKSAHALAVQNGTMPNNVMVCITDDAAGEEAWTYSTEETNTGKTWIDGKPIYRRVCLTTSVISEDSWSYAGISSSLFANVDTGISATVARPSAVSAGTNMIKWLKNTGFMTYQDYTAVHGGIPAGVYIILEYTKTTD